LLDSEVNDRPEWGVMRRRATAPFHEVSRKSNGGVDNVIPSSLSNRTMRSRSVPTQLGNNDTVVTWWTVRVSSST
jgi:hypothetical protein